MTMPRSALAALCLTVLGSSLALAESPAPCGRSGWSIERERAAFAAGSLPKVASGSALPAGSPAALVTLVPAADLTLPVPSDRPAKPGTYGGTVTVAAPAEPGTYQVTLSDEAWVDVSQDGRTTLKATAFAGKIGCPEVHKSVRFTLGAAPVTIEVSRVPAPQIKIGVFKAE